MQLGLKPTNCMESHMMYDAKMCSMSSMEFGRRFDLHTMLMQGCNCDFMLVLCAPYGFDSERHMRGPTSAFVSLKIGFLLSDVKRSRQYYLHFDF